MNHDKQVIWKSFFFSGKPPLGKLHQIPTYFESNGNDFLHFGFEWLKIECSSSGRTLEFISGPKFLH